jgi:hypothetical protein
MTSELLKFGAIFMKSLSEIFVDFDTSSNDEILDNRDLTEFSDCWVNAFEETKQNKIHLADKKKIDKMRKEIFMMVISKTNSSDLSAYITEDFELIASHLLTNVNNTWVASLCASYLNKNIPQGQLKKIDKTLKELID